MTLAHAIGNVINLSLAMSIVGAGLTATLDDATSLLRQPRLLVRSFLSMNVLMPVLAAGAVALINPAAAVAIAIIALSLSPVPPILPSKQFKAGGRGAYVIGLLAAAAVASIVIVPIGVGLLGWIFGVGANVSMTAVLRVVVTSVLVPLALGLAVHHFWTEAAVRIAPWVSMAASLLLGAAFVPVLLDIWPAMIAAVGNGTILILVAFAAAGVGIGHYLGGPDSGDRTVLALATATRHPGVAAAIAAATFPDVHGVLAIILWHLIISAVVVAPYVNWQRQRHMHVRAPNDIFADPIHH